MGETQPTSVEDDWDWPVPAASAAGPAFPCLKKDNCIQNGRHRAVYRVEVSVRAFAEKHGLERCALLTVTTPSECLEAGQFQVKWHSYHSNVIRKTFPSGVWIRERQPRTGNWHAHAVVNVGWDVRTGFPFTEVASRNYRHVNPALRELWKRLRETAVAHGFGRTELLPLKYNGDACAAYLTKYLSKAFGSEKCAGEERCRLFGTWGGERFVFPGFMFLSSRITQKRKQWLAEELGLDDPLQLKIMLGPHWWFHFGASLSEVILPNEYYQVGSEGEKRWDDLGLKACARDWAKWPGVVSEDLAQQSRYRLFHAIGAHIYGAERGQATRFALNIMAAVDPRPAAPARDPQLLLAIEGMRQNCSP